MVASAVGVGLLIADYRKRTGLWVNAWHIRRARPAMVTAVAGIYALFLGGLALRYGLGWSAGPVVAGVLMVPTVIVLGGRVDAALQRDLRS